MNFSGELQQFTGVPKIVIDASDYRSCVSALFEQFPALAESKLHDMAVAIDGVIIVDPLLEPLTEDSEVHFLHFVAGG